jgi:hypothetical protein
MAAEIDARRPAERLIGRTIPTLADQAPNIVLGTVGSNVKVGTHDSPEGENVSLRQLQRGLDILIEDGEIRIEPDTFGGYRRSSFIGAALGQLHGVELTTSPTWVRLAASSLGALLARGCAEVTDFEGVRETSSRSPPFVRR